MQWTVSFHRNYTIVYIFTSEKVYAFKTVYTAPYFHAHNNDSAVIYYLAFAKERRVFNNSASLVLPFPPIDPYPPLIST